MIRFILLCIFHFSFSAAAGPCDPWKLVNDPSLRDNQEFWNELGNLNGGAPSPDELRHLLQKYGVDSDGSFKPASQAGTTPATSAGQTINHHHISPQAQKSIGRLQPHLRADLDEFLELTSGSGDFLKPIRDNPGRWQMKKLEMMENAWSARLNHGYRVIFRHGEGGTLHIIDVSKTLTHNGH